MNLLERIMELDKKDIAVDYTIINQKENGTFEEGEPNTTYTISVHEKWTFGDVLFEEGGLYDLEEGLLWGVQKGESYLRGRNICI